MRVMYLLFSFTVGGTERLVADICNEMVEKNEVYLYILNNNYSRELLSTLDNRIHKILYNRSPGSHNKLKTVADLTNYIVKNHIDIVHCNSFDAPRLLFLKLFLFNKCKVIHTIHGLGQYKELKRFDVIYRNKICDQFIAISESVKKDIIESGADCKKVTVVYNAINVKKFSSISKQSHSGIVIGNVARFKPNEKGQDILIDAIANLKQRYPNIKCIFAGGPDKESEDIFIKYQENVKKRGLSKNIIFLGNVDNIPQFLAGVDIFVLPSRLEGFGISLIEAMAAGIPCIASNLNGPSEIIGNDERGFLFTPNSSYDLSEKIEYVINNYDEILKRQIANINYVRNNFDIKSMCNKLQNIYCGD